MTRLLRYLLLVVALLFSQHAAMLHGLGHAEHEFALATEHDGEPPGLDHGDEVCAAFAALAHAVGNAAFAPSRSCAPARVQAASFNAVHAAPRIVYDSRAPPLSA